MESRTCTQICRRKKVLCNQHLIYGSRCNPQSGLTISRKSIYAFERYVHELSPPAHRSPPNISFVLACNRQSILLVIGIIRILDLKLNTSLDRLLCSCCIRSGSSLMQLHFLKGELGAVKTINSITVLPILN